MTSFSFLRRGGWRSATANIGWIRPGETVLVMNTGSGLKYIDQITASPQKIKQEESILI